jgi:hypothetical protein
VSNGAHAARRCCMCSHRRNFRRGLRHLRERVPPFQCGLTVGHSAVNRAGESSTLSAGRGATPRQPTRGDVTRLGRGSTVNRRRRVRLPYVTPPIRSTVKIGLFRSVMRPASQPRCLRGETGSTPVQGATFSFFIRGHRSKAGPQFSKLTMWVRLPLSAPCLDLS